ncbi:MAG: Rab family GTPase [Promethearchaeota archaeon]
MSYDYTFKIIMLGDKTVGKTSLTIRYISGFYQEDLKLTIGTDFHSKTTIFNGKKVKLQIWDFGGEERFRFLLSQYCKGANGAFFLYDITNRNTLNQLPIWTQIMREHAGNIPIMLVGTKAHLEENRAVTREQGIQIAEDQNLSGFVEVSSKTGQNVEKLFEIMVSLLFEESTPFRLEYDADVVIPKLKYPKFKINEFITLRLEYGKTIIYIGEKRFDQCNYLVFDLLINESRDNGEIKSIDEVEETLQGQEYRKLLSKFKISPETKFWWHYSNIQAWVKFGYDTRLLHRTLAFPLLKALVKIGDPEAKKAFKEEIAMRIESGYPNVLMYLINHGYLEYLNEEELDTVLESSKFKKNLPRSLLKQIPPCLALKIKDKLSTFQK